MLSNNKTSNILIMVVTVLVSVGIGYFLGAMQSGDESSTAAEVVADEAGKDVATAEGSTDDKAKGVTAAELAKLKSVAETVESPNGDFSLVTVIEGEEQNRFLRSSLQAVTNQRRNLAMLGQKFDQMDPKLVQQREILAGQINEIRQALQQNLRFMAQNFGYTLANNYLLVPHNATLSSLAGKGEDQIKTVIYTFADSESYKKFQEKTNAYTKLKRDQVMAYRETLTDEEKEQPLPKMPLTDDMKKARKVMIAEYKCDPERNYVVEFQKTALYFRRAQQ
ncbi:MAG: hypothetical protein P8P36_08700 [Akkermansiaceae bacterium]|nr:hypothetical protein [Akkermansiaceae bacterium]